MCLSTEGSKGIWNVSGMGVDHWYIKRPPETPGQQRREVMYVWGSAEPVAASLCLLSGARVEEMRWSQAQNKCEDCYHLPIRGMKDEGPALAWERGTMMRTKRRFQEEEQIPEQKRSRALPLSCSSEVHQRTLSDVLEKTSYGWMQGLDSPGSVSM